MRGVGESVGLAAAVALSTLAAYLLPAPPGMEPLFKTSAVISGLIGYWISRQRRVAELRFSTVLITSGLLIVFVSVGGVFYMEYLHEPTPDRVDDVLGFFLLNSLFVAVCFLLGVIYGDFLRKAENG